MRSCEYLTVDKKDNDRKTKKLRVRNIVFRRNGRVMKATTESKLEKASSVSITFEDQKNGEKMETVTQFRNNTNFCPVAIWSRIISRILSYPTASANTPVDAIHIGGKLYGITSEIMRDKIRNILDEIGEDVLGFPSSDAGTHSIRSSFAMLLLLNGEIESIIMKKGRWKSDAFLRYIREQIDKFGFDTSKKIIGSIGENFFVIPHIDIKYNNK